MVSVENHAPGLGGVCLVADVACPVCDGFPREKMFYVGFRVSVEICTFSLSVYVTCCRWSS